MAGFMAGFGTKFSELIEEDRKYYRDRAAKRQEYLQTYGTRAVADREGKANAALGVANYLITNGISKEDVRYVVDTSGVQGLAQLKATIDSRTDLTADEKSNLVKKAKDYVAENPDEDLNTVVKRAYGLYKSSDNPVKRERSLFGSILGLDSRMMEDEVMDDLYINGYTGRDVYRIMGSAGPTPGAPLDLDLPSKPPSPTVLNNTAKFLESQFETSIDSRIASIEQKMLKADPKTPQYSTLADERTKLENMKAKGLLALGQYATEYDQELFNFARAQEEALPGAITRNSYLFEFLPAYNTFFDEAEDEAKVSELGSMNGAPGFRDEEGTATVTPPEAKVTAPTATAHKVETEAEAMELLNSGTVAVGDTIQIGNGQPRPVTSLPEVVATPKTTDLGDMTGAPGFREESSVVFNPKPDLTVEDRINAKREATTQVAEAVSDVAEDVSSKLKALDKTLDTVAGNAVLGIRAKANTALGAMAQVAGNDELADSFYRVSVEAEDGTRKGVSFDQGLVTGINQILDNLGVPDYSKLQNSTAVNQTAVNQYVDDPNVEGRNLSADLGIGYEPATVRLFSTMNRLKKLRLAVNQAPEQVTPEAVLEAVAKPEDGTDAVYTIEEIKAYAENRLGAREKQAMEDRIRDDARQFLQDEKSFPQPLPTIIVEKLENDIVEEAKVDVEVMRIVQQLDKKGETPSRKDIEDLKTALELNQEIDTSTDELYRGPISGKTLVEKLDDIWNFYTKGEEPEYNPRAIGTVGSRDLGLRDTTDDVRPPRGEAPDRAASLSRPATPEADQQEFDSPRNMAVENFTTRGINATPRGIMTPRKEFAPKLGQAQFGDLIDRVHGSSKAAEAFNKKVSSGTVKAADVTRLIKATRKLPKTTSRGMLLDSLFDLRDALNKR